MFLSDLGKRLITAPLAAACRAQFTYGSLKGAKKGKKLFASCNTSMRDDVVLCLDDVMLCLDDVMRSRHDVVLRALLR